MSKADKERIKSLESKLSRELRHNIALSEQSANLLHKVDSLEKEIVTLKEEALMWKEKYVDQLYRMVEFAEAVERRRQ